MTIASPTLPSIALGTSNSQSNEQAQEHFHSILSNWKLSATNYDAILPAALHVDIWTAPLLAAVHELSTLTVGQKERAHNLVNTYFQERIRQATYRGNAGSIYAQLEVEDVEKASRSVARMSKGHALQNQGKEVVIDRTVNGEATAETGVKRKTSDETLTQVEDRPGKRPKTLSDDYPTTFPCQPFSPPESSHSPPVRPVYLAKHHSLPRITTVSPPPQAYAPPPHLVQAAQQATHEFNVRRLALANMEAQVEVLRQMFVDARQRMEEARGSLDGWVC